jgi:hypothetical protein
MSLGISSSVYPTATSAATLAIGKPVALEARADERETRGFISITRVSPFSGLTANWTLDPPVSISTALITRRARSRRIWYSRSVRVCDGAMVMLSPVCTPIGSRFSMLQTTTKLSALSRITSSSNSFHPSTDCSSQAWPIGETAIALRTASGNSCGLCTQEAPVPPSANEARTRTG